MLNDFLKVTPTKGKVWMEWLNFQLLVHAASLKNYVFSPELVYTNGHMGLG